MDQVNTPATGALKAVWFAEDGEIFITFGAGRGSDPHFESHPVKSAGAQGWIRRHLRYVNGKTPSAYDVDNFTNDLISKAYETNLRVDTFLRVAGFDGRIYVDSGTPDWSCVQIDETGWRIIPQAPVAFRRNAHMYPLPFAESGGSLEMLSEFAYFSSREDFLLFISFLINAYHPTGPYFHLFLVGEKGSAKSGIARLTQKLIHPSSSSLKGMPKDEDNLVIEAYHNRIVMVDNENDLGKWLPNALCRLATGTGMSSRSLYTNRDQMAFTVARPAVLTAHKVPSAQEDLIERSIIVNLNKPERRVSEKSLTEKFDRMGGKIMGAVFDAISRTLFNQKHISEDSLPLHRMADASYFIACGFEKIGWQSPQDFLMAIEAKQMQAIALRSKEKDPLISALVKAMAEKEIWEDTPTKILEELQKTAKNPHFLPKTANVLSRRLGDLKDHFLPLGLSITTGLHRSGGTERLIRIKNQNISDDRLSHIVMEKTTESRDYDDITI